MVVVLVFLEDLGEGPAAPAVAAAISACARAVARVAAGVAIAVGPAPGRVVTVGNRVGLAVTVGVDGLLDQLRDEPRATREDVLGSLPQCFR